MLLRLPLVLFLVLLLLPGCGVWVPAARPQGVDTPPPCAANGDCASGVCGLADAGAARRCVLEADLTFVRPGIACGGDGTRQNPLCSWPPRSQKTALRLLPGPAAPPALFIAGETEWTVYAEGSVLPGVSVSGAQARLTLIGGRVSGPVLCGGSGSSALALEEVEVSEVAGVGLDAAGCEVRVRRSLLRSNGDGAIRLRSGSYQILDTFIEDNQSTIGNAAVVLNADVVPVDDLLDEVAFSRNTVLRNKAGRSAGGILCLARERRLGPTTLCGNSTFDGAQSSGCTFAAEVPCP